MPRACTQGGHLIRPRAARREPRLERPGNRVRESASPRRLKSTRDRQNPRRQGRRSANSRRAQGARRARPRATGPFARTLDRARRRRPRIGGLRPQQAQDGRGSRDGHCARAAASDRDAGRHARGRPALQPGPLDRRHSRAITVTESDGRGRGAAGVRHDRPRQGRGWVQPDFRGAARAESRGVRAVHAGGSDRAARPEQDPDRRQARGRDRQVRHRRQADGFAVAAQERDRDDLPLPYPRPARDGARSGHPRRGDRPARVCHSRLRETGRGRNRRRHQ